MSVRTRDICRLCRRRSDGSHWFSGLQYACGTATAAETATKWSSSKTAKPKKTAAPPSNLRYIYPEFLPDPDPKRRNMIREKLERMDMMNRRSNIDIPEFYVGNEAFFHILDLLLFQNSIKIFVSRIHSRCQNFGSPCTRKNEQICRDLYWTVLFWSKIYVHFEKCSRSSRNRGKITSQCDRIF